jgi:sporulation protein YlmC with PRC-barrel domain
MEKNMSDPLCDSSAYADAVEDYSHELISSAKVEGMRVVNATGEKLGTVHSLMIHKRTGQVAYALLSFGGFLGIGTRVHPVPWEKLQYDIRLHAYRIALTREQLEKAPTLHLDDAERPTARSYDERMYQYYGARHYWDV